MALPAPRTSQVEEGFPHRPWYAHPRVGMVQGISTSPIIWDNT